MEVSERFSLSQEYPPHHDQSMSLSVELFLLEMAGWRVQEHGWRDSRKGVVVASWLLGPWGEHHGGREAIHADGRDVHLCAATGRKLEGELGWTAGCNWTQSTPEVNAGGQ